MQEINCIFCKKSTDNVVIRENGYTGKQCTCGLIYVSPRPSLDEIIDVYGHDDAHSSANAQIQNEFTKRLMARHHLRKLQHHKKSGYLLEIGAGAGYFLDESKKYGFEPVGIELNHLQAEFIRSHHQIPCEETPLATYPQSGSQFDVIYHCDVISHFYEPVDEFRLMHKNMADNGILMFETGNYGDMDKRYYKYIPRFQYPDHLFFFGVDNLRTLLDETGFDLLEIHRFSVLPHLHLRALARKFAGIFKRRKTNVTPESRPKNVSNAKLELKRSNTFDPKSHAKNVWSYLNYIFRYKVGRALAGAVEPQTILLIARKRS